MVKGSQENLLAPPFSSAAAGVELRRARSAAHRVGRRAAAAWPGAAALAGGAAWDEALAAAAAGAGARHGWVHSGGAALAGGLAALPAGQH